MEFMHKKDNIWTINLVSIYLSVEYTNFLLKLFKTNNNENNYDKLSI